MDRAAVLAQEVEVAEHGHQQIVEVMCHTAGELADHLHLLRLEQLSLGAFPLLDFGKHRGMRLFELGGSARTRSSRVSLSCRGLPRPPFGR